MHEVLDDLHRGATWLNTWDVAEPMRSGSPDCAVFFDGRKSVVIRLLTLLEFVDPAKNSVDPQRNEFAV